MTIGSHIGQRHPNNANSVSHGHESPDGCADINKNFLSQLSTDCGYKVELDCTQK